MVSGSADQTVRLWDVASGKAIRVLHGHRGAVNAVALSLDGGTILSGGADRILRLWERASGKEKHTLAGHGDWIWSVAFSPSGNRVLSGSADRTMRLWDVKTGKEVRTFGGHYLAVTSVAFSSDGKWALSGSADASVRLWDVGGSGQLLPRLIGHKGPVYAVAFVGGAKKGTVPSRAGSARYAMSAGADKSLHYGTSATNQASRNAGATGMRMAGHRKRPVMRTWYAVFWDTPLRFTALPFRRTAARSFRGEGMERCVYGNCQVAHDAR